MAGDRSKWLDEAWTGAIAAPYLLAFLPWTQDAVSRGFAIMGTAPGWYQIGVATAIGWAFLRPNLANLLLRR